MPKFDVVVGNPPYKQKLHLKFLDLAIELSTQYILFVEPGGWLLDERIYSPIRLKTEKPVKDKLNLYGGNIELFNSKKYFDVEISTYLSITFIDKLSVEKNIKVNNTLNKEISIYTDAYEISKYGNSPTYLSLKNKILNCAKIDNLFNHRSKENKKYYINLAEIRGHISTLEEKIFNDDFFTFIPKDKKIDTKPTHTIYFSFETIESSKIFLNYLKTNFARFSLSIYKINTQQDEGELKSVPWLDFSQEWTDEKLYKYLNLTPEEIKFIETNIPKYY